MRVDTKKRSDRNAARRVVRDNDKAGVPLRKGAVSRQVGGDHYKSLAIQPAEFIHRNGLGFLEGNVVKYIVRHRQKGGRDDVLKAIHYCQLLLEFEYGGDPN
jgi:hypothetical protein